MIGGMRWSFFLMLCLALAAWALTLQGVRRTLPAEYPAPNLSEWYKSLMIPDAPGMHSCCGEADAYWADETEVGPAGELVAIVTDTQENQRALPNGTFINRRPVQVGTRITVPPSKIRKVPSENPTGHTIIFLSSTLSVYCYEPQPLM